MRYEQAGGNCGGIGWWDFYTVALEDAATPLIDIWVDPDSQVLPNGKRLPCTFPGFREFVYLFLWFVWRHSARQNDFFLAGGSLLVRRFVPRSFLIRCLTLRQRVSPSSTPRSSIRNSRPTAGWTKARL